MGRILEYVVLLSSLSLTFGSEQYQRATQTANYEREKKDNFTHVLKWFPGDGDDHFDKKLLPPQGPQGRRKPNQMLTSLGLQAYAVDDDFGGNRRKKNSSENGFRFLDLSKRNSPALSQRLQPLRNNRNFYSEYYPSQKLSKLIGYNSQNNYNIQKNPNSLNAPKQFNNQNNHHNSFKNQRNHNSSSDQNAHSSDLYRRYHKEGRIARYQKKICDPCNSVPWIPLLKVPDSYRQQRTHITELLPTPQQNFNFDFHSHPSGIHNVLLPPVPLAPPVYDATISGSFGLPVGNVPTSHGLLAPIATEITNYAIDYSNPFNYYSPPALLDNNNFPELSPVPIVPIHDSGQFFHFDATIPDLVPPTKPVDVSKVVLTITEQEPTDLRPPNHKYPTPDPTPESSAGASHSHNKHINDKDFGKLEIIKSIPIAEFTSSVKVPHPQEELPLPLYPPLQSEHPNDFQAHQHSDSDFLVPPVNNEVTFDSRNSSDSKTEILGEESAPKPLTSPSLSWLFSDHTSPPSDAKSTSSITSFVTDAQEIASVVNNELRPVPTPKSKKIQIIIPYTTKGKTGHDSNAFESVRHEVYRPPANRTLTADDRHHGSKYQNEMQHIIATNLRDILREEIEKSQNYPLQNNIDNWTALEYSNHKTVETKAPKDVIAQALAVTSIPGTSISHFLLPSKKIPNEYFVTTPLPAYDEPSSPVYKVENFTVNSRPFTAKPYATTNIYNPKFGNATKETLQTNHERNYTEVERERVNTWKRINENLVLPEARSRTTAATRTNHRQASASPNTEKVQIVTPISLTSRRNHAATPTIRRTTRHTHTTPAPTARTRKPLLLNRLNSTKLEKISNQTSPFNRKFTYNSTTTTKITTTVATTVTTTTTAKSSAPTVTNTTASATENGDGSNATTKEEPAKGEPVSINDIFPFRNKELPWENKQNGSQPALRMGRQRKSLIKQINLHKSKATVTSS